MRSGGNVFRRTMEKRGIGVAIDLFRFLISLRSNDYFVSQRRAGDEKN